VRSYDAQADSSCRDEEGGERTALMPTWVYTGCILAAIADVQPERDASDGLNTLQVAAVRELSA
jgi:hypothetical protein